MGLLSFRLFRKAAAASSSLPEISKCSVTPRDTLSDRTARARPGVRASPAPHDRAGLPPEAEHAGRRVPRWADAGTRRETDQLLPDTPRAVGPFPGELGHLEQASPQRALVAPRYSKLLTPGLLLTLTSGPSSLSFWAQNILVRRQPANRGDACLCAGPGLSTAAGQKCGLSPAPDL